MKTLKFTTLKIFFLSIFSFVLFLSSINAQDKAALIEELMNKYNEYGQFNGSVLVAENGNVILKKGYGYANMEWNVPNTADTKFRLASITKQFTSMLIMQLVEEDKINLDGKLSDYLPYYRKDVGDQVTIHNLLTHTSGIPNLTNKPPGVLEKMGSKHYEVKELIEEFCSDDLEFEPGSKYSYCNSGYNILGAVIEEVTGKPYEVVLRERIFEPLGMENSGIDDNEPVIEKRASGYNKGIIDYENTNYLDMSLVYAAGAMYSTVEDLFLWNQALYTDKLLSENNKEIMFTPFLQNYAYGWGVSELPIGDENKKVIRHSGGINGFNTVIIRLVDDKHLIVLLNNFTPCNLNKISKGIADILYGEEYEVPKRSLAEKLSKTVMLEGVSEGIKQLKELKEKQENEYYVDENEINNFGYYLLEKDRVDDAIEVFKLNVELFPDAFNPYDSLGEAYMIKGEKELAIKNYEKSVELNPGNTNGIKMLKKLKE
ncbi:MAG: serine hydrolase [Ignavibacteria bacterium]|nr:serine hydrolase [Ignavibacteria bacterium]